MFVYWAVHLQVIFHGCILKPGGIAGIVDETNKEFARVEQIKDFRLIDVLLTAEDEELTATMKLKRSFVEKKHKELIDEMYGRE